MYERARICAMVMMLGCSPSVSDSTQRDLTIRARSPTASYTRADEFQLSVTLHNRGGSPWVILPGSIHREYTALDSGNARYVPFPGPRTAPWQGAFRLEQGGSQEIELVGHRDGDGIWVLEPGRYDLVIRIEVTPELAGAAAGQTARLGAPVWQGRLAARALRVRFNAEPVARPDPRSARPSVRALAPGRMEPGLLGAGKGLDVARP